MISITEFEKEQSLIAQLGKGNAHMIWALGLYLDSSDLVSLAADGLTDGGNDKKIDFLLYDQTTKRIIIAQGYYTEREKDKAPANKASDLMIATAWLLDGDLETHNINDKVKRNIIECRSRIESNDVEQIDILFVHNAPASANVKNELETCAQNLKVRLGDSIRIHTQELGTVEIERAYVDRHTQIIVKKDIEFDAIIVRSEKGPDWEALITIIDGSWLSSLYKEHGDSLFSANYRGFLGTGKRRKINLGIKTTAEKSPADFLVFNNGITALTNKIESQNDGKIKINGISIINGAQTTGSIGGITGDISQVRVLCRIVKCNDPEKAKKIVQFNNTQNEITTWDQYANDEEQKLLAAQFESLNHPYSLKRGFDSSSCELGIEKVAQPSLAIQGYFTDANRGKNDIFESAELYRRAFQNRPAKKLLFAYCFARAADEIRIFLNQKTERTAEEEKLYSLFAYLSFKNYLLALTGASLESIIGKKISIKEVSFNEEYSKKSLTDIIAHCKPIITVVSTLAAINIDPKNASDLIKTEAGFNKVIEKIKASLATTYAVIPRPKDFIDSIIVE